MRSNSNHNSCKPAAAVSVAIPCFNAGRWVAEAIRSAQFQDFGETIEVSVWDDGSTDGSLAVASSIEPAVKVGGGPNRGGNFARNRLLAAACGRWIQFLDADDYLLPHKIRVQLKENEADDADVIYSPVLEERWHDGQPAALQQVPLDVEQDIFAQWFSWELPQTGAALWKRESLQKIGGWNEAMPCCQEHELYLRAIQNGLRFKYVPTPGAVYRIWSEGTVCRKDPVRVILVRNQLFDAMIDWMRQRNLWREEHRRVAGRICFEMARTWARHDLQAAASYFHRRKDEGLIHMEGPAAPPRYLQTYRLLGFRAAESIARWTRRQNRAPRPARSQPPSPTSSIPSEATQFK